MSDLWVCNPQISLELFEAQHCGALWVHLNIQTMFFFSHISSAACRYVIKRRASVRALSLEKLPYQLLQQLCPLSFILSLSKSQKKSCWVSLEDIFSWDTSPPSLSAFGARFPTTLPGDPPGAFRGTAGDKMTRSPLCSHLSKEPSECPPSSTCWRSGLFHRAAPTATAFFPSPHLCLWAAVPSLSPPSFASCSPLVQLFSHSCDWLVSRGLSPVTFTQWCFGCSSGKQVSMFVLFCFYPD